MERGEIIFVVKPETSEDLQHALFLLSYYRVRVEFFSDGEDSSSTYMVVDEADEVRKGDFLLAQMAMQMNFHQGNADRCPHCEDLPTCDDCKYNEGDSGNCEHCTRLFCGHLTFTKKINPAF